jgi:hypothetical protein
VESAVAEALAEAATTTTPEAHVFDTMVDAMFQNVVAIAESEGTLRKHARTTAAAVFRTLKGVSARV